MPSNCPKPTNMPLPEQKSPPTPNPEDAGFQANLRGASLWDLVQMECLAFSRRVVRITTIDDVGYLYFSGGQIVHARTRSLEAEAAAMTILGWEEGSFEVVDAPWPERDTITSTWQSLVMRAAQQRDEAPGVPNLVAFPKAAETEPSSSSPKTEADASSSMTTEIDSVVRLNPDGSTVESHGPAAEELEALAAYCCQIAQLIGEALGMDDFQGLETESKQWRVIVHFTQDGMVEAARAPHAVTAARMKELLGLQ